MHYVSETNLLLSSGEIAKFYLKKESVCFRNLMYFFQYFCDNGKCSCKCCLCVSCTTAVKQLNVAGINDIIYTMKDLDLIDTIVVVVGMMMMTMTIIMQRHRQPHLIKITIYIYIYIYILLYTFIYGTLFYNMLRPMAQRSIYIYIYIYILNIIRITVLQGL